MHRGIAYALRGAAALVLVFAAAACASSATPRAQSQPSTASTSRARAPHASTATTWFLSASEIARMRENVRTKPSTRRAWRQTKRRADAALSSTPRPADPDGDYRERGDPTCGSGTSGWYCGLYLPGLEDGRNARALAFAYLITHERRYASKAKEILLAWARGYDPPAPLGMVGHFVAEPVGFMLKGFQAYALVKGVFSGSERREFRRWASTFVSRGKTQADSARDRPWSPEAPYGNSPAWARSLAVLAAAVVGRRTLEQTLDWNWSHTTPGGNDYGWARLIDGAMLPSGHMVEEDVRKSIAYALYTLEPLMLIADVAQRAGYRHDLWRYRTEDGKGILTAVAYYTPYLVDARAWPEGYVEPSNRSNDSVRSEYRAAFELVANDVPGVSAARRAVTYGGPKVRGANEDPHITGFNAITAGIGDARFAKRKG